jgi:hypothetical protein
LTLNTDQGPELNLDSLLRIFLQTLLLGESSWRLQKGVQGHWKVYKARLGICVFYPQGPLCSRVIQVLADSCGRIADPMSDTLLPGL